MRLGSVLLAGVVATTLLAAPVQAKTYPHVLEIVSLSLPDAVSGSAPNQVVVEVRYEIRSVMVRGHRYFIYLAARPESPTRTGSFVIPKTREALQELKSRTGTVRLSVPLDTLVEARAGTEPLILWVSLGKRSEEDVDPIYLGHPLARSNPVAVFLAQ